MIDALVIVVGKMALHSSQQNAPGQIERQQQQYVRRQVRCYGIKTRNKRK